MLGGRFRQRPKVPPRMDARMEGGRGARKGGLIDCQIWDDQVTHGNGETLRVLT